MGETEQPTSQAGSACALCIDDLLRMPQLCVRHGMSPCTSVCTCTFDQLLQLQEVLSSLLDACSYGTGSLAKVRALLDVCMRLRSGWSWGPKACKTLDFAISCEASLELCNDSPSHG